MRILLVCKRYLLTLTLAFGAAASAQSQTIKTGEDVISAMHKAYAGKWYTHLTFEQKTTFYGPDEDIELVQWWFEALKLPGNLAIKFDSPNSQNGILFTRHSQYGFSEGELIQAHPYVHDLLVLGFDVYHQPESESVYQLRAAGYNLDEWYEDEWRGRAVYVVGAGSASTQKNQFWIDKERLVFVRSLKAGRGNSLQETQFNAYERLQGGWIAPEVVMIVNGQKVLHEEYHRIRVPDVISDDVFNPRTFIESVW